MDDLTKLLYRKKMLEVAMTKFGMAADTYTSYHKALKTELENNKDLSSLEKNRLNVELIDATNKAGQAISSFKESQRQYKHFVRPKIEKLVPEDKKKSIQFIDADKEAERLKKKELYGTITKIPDNVEHVQIIDDLEKSIKINEQIVEETEKALKKAKGLDKARMQKDLFEIRLKVDNLKKRLAKRKDYYANQFKPVYDRDMRECEERLDDYLDIAKEMAETNIDPKLIFLLKEHEEHKDDDEKLWLFYTALKARLSNIAKHMRKNKGNFKGKMHLAKKELYTDLKLVDEKK